MNYLLHILHVSGKNNFWPPSGGPRGVLIAQQKFWGINTRRPSAQRSVGEWCRETRTCLVIRRFWRDFVVDLDDFRGRNTYFGVIYTGFLSGRRLRPDFFLRRRSERCLRPDFCLPPLCCASRRVLEVRPFRSSAICSVVLSCRLCRRLTLFDVVSQQYIFAAEYWGVSVFFLVLREILGFIFGLWGCLKFIRTTS